MTVEEWCCGIATTCSCRASDLGSSEHGEHISPCVSGNQRETHTVRICAICAEDRHIDENCRNLEDQSYTCKVRRRDKDASTKIDGRPEFTLDWWSEAACCWWERQVVCSEYTEHKIVSIPVQSSDPELAKSIVGTSWNPRLDERPECWIVNLSHRQKPLFPRQSCLRERESQKLFQDDCTFGGTVTHLNVSVAMQPVKAEWQRRAVVSAETGSNERSCQKNPMKYADATKIRSANETWMSVWNSTSRNGWRTVPAGAAKTRDSVGGTSFRKRRFAHENCGREATDRERPGRTSRNW